MATRRKTGTIKSNETLFAILDVVRALDEPTLTNVAEASGVAKSTAHRHLATLRDHQYVVKRDGEYELSLRFLDLGGHVREQRPIHRQMKSVVTDVARETDEYAGFVVEEGGLGTYLYSETGSNAVRNFARVGRRTHLHQITKGKVVLAHLPESRVRDIVDEHGLPARNEHTITDFDELREELDAIREQGYAYSHGEHTDGLWCVSVPVSDQSGDVVGGLGVAGPSHRMRGERVQSELLEYLKGTVTAFELNMSYA